MQRYTSPSSLTIVVKGSAMICRRVVVTCFITIASFAVRTELLFAQPDLADLQNRAVQGDADAQYNLGYMYYNSEGVPEDYVLAYMWFNLAAAQGAEDAVGNRDFVAGLMTPADISEAQRLAREWQEAHQ